MENIKLIESLNSDSLGGGSTAVLQLLIWLDDKKKLDDKKLFWIWILPE